MSERAIEQESSVDGWREAVRTQETRVAVLTAHSSQLEDQLSRYQSSNVAMSDQGAEKEVRLYRVADVVLLCCVADIVLCFAVLLTLHCSVPDAVLLCHWHCVVLLCC